MDNVRIVTGPVTPTMHMGWPAKTEKIGKHAKTIRHTTRHSRMHDDRRSRNEQLRDIRKVAEQLPKHTNEFGRMVVTDREALKIIRRAREKCNRVRISAKTARIQCTFLKRPPTRPLTLKCGGTPTTDRREWLKEALDFGRQRFTDENNDSQTQHRRIQELRDARDVLYAQGIRPHGPSLFDTVQARAELNNNKAQDMQGICGEMIKALPYDALRSIHCEFFWLFNELSPQPSAWKSTEYFGIPKKVGTDELTKI